MKKYTVLVDVDGVLANFHQRICDVINEAGLHTHLGLKEPVTPHYFKTWEMFGGMNPTVRDHCYQVWDSEGFADSLELLPGAVEGMRRLAEVAEVFICTSPTKTSRTWMYDRNKWLERHFGLGRSAIIHTAAKHMVSGDMLIDDGPHHITKWEAYQKGRALLWDAPWNRKEGEGLVAVGSWDEVLAHVEDHKRSK